ncbi:MAG: hypothetical protein ABIP33_06260 [Pseudolysinimonas sp.]
MTAKEPKTSARRTPLDWGKWLLERFQRQLLSGLNIHEAQHPGSMYRGTADAAKVAKRRARNKVARRSRRINRRAAK